MTILFEKKKKKKKKKRKLMRVKLQAFKSIIAIFRPNFICALVIFNVHVHRSFIFMPISKLQNWKKRHEF